MCLTGGTLVFTATVSGPTGSPTPTGSMNWTITAPRQAVGSVLVQLGAYGVVERSHVYVLHYRR